MKYKKFTENEYAPTMQNTTAFSGFLGTFKKWYDGHRGKWNEVEQAAKINPNINNFINYIASQKFSPNIMGRLGNELEKLVKETDPNHGYKQYVDSDDLITGDDDVSKVQSINQNANTQNTNTQKDATKILFSKLKEFEARLKNIERKFQQN